MCQYVVQQYPCSHSEVIKNQKNLHIFFLPYFHSTFCPIRCFFIRHFVPFGVFTFDILSRSAFFPFKVFSIWHFVPFGLLSRSTLVPFDVLSHSAFFPFDVLSHSVFCLLTFCRSTFCPFGVCYFDILSVNHIIIIGGHRHQHLLFQHRKKICWTENCHSDIGRVMISTSESIVISDIKTYFFIPARTKPKILDFTGKRITSQPQFWSMNSGMSDIG